MTKLVVTVRNSAVNGWFGEEFEDDLADFIARYGLFGEIYNDGTGNSTQFPIEREEYEEE